LSNKLQNAFDSIHAEDSLKQTVKLHIQGAVAPSKKRFAYKPMLAAACVIILCLGVWFGYSLYFTPVTVISVDINPSIELKVNRFDKVVGVEAFNNDGADLISTVNVRHLNYQKAVDKLLATESISSLVEKDELVCITVYGKSKVSSSMVTKLSEHNKSRDHVRCAVGTENAQKNAHAKGMSFGKYDAYLELQSLYPDVTVEEVKDLTMREIRDKIGSNGINKNQNGKGDKDGKDNSFVDNSGYDCSDNGHHGGNSQHHQHGSN